MAQISALAPASTRPPQPAIENPETLDALDDEGFDVSRATPIASSGVGEVSADDMEWAEMIGLSAMPSTREGAEFVRLAEDVFIIPVIGGQPLHHDRHLAELGEDRVRGFSEHTWNLVVSPSEGQFLLCEVADQMFEHYALDYGSFIYFNTVNRHAVTRKSRHDTLVLVQVDGYKPDERDAAIARIAEVLAARPTRRAL